MTVYRALHIPSCCLQQMKILTSNRDVACRDGDASPLEEQHFKGHTARQIAAEMAGGFSKKIWTKMRISRDPTVGISREASKMKINALGFGWFQREVWENCSRGDRPRPKFGAMTLSLEKVSLARRFPCFFDFEVQWSTEQGQLSLRWGVQ